jgi:hypothetical protein
MEADKATLTLTRHASLKRTTQGFLFAQCIENAKGRSVAVFGYRNLLHRGTW